MASYDFDLFTIGAGSGGVARQPRAPALRRARGDLRGEPRRRHLRHPRLRAEEAARLWLALRREFEDAAASAGRCRERALRLGRRSSPPRTRRSTG